MRLFDYVAPSDALQDLFDREREAVLLGRFDVLRRISTDKERLLQAVGRQGAPKDALTRLLSQSRRNGRLLDAMRDGIVAAQRRVEALKGTASGLQTYDSTGRKQSLTPLPQSPRHRV